MSEPEIRLTIKNYRCFPERHPAVFRLRPGYTSFIGPNNAGKSTLLRFFYEFRPLFQAVVARLYASLLQPEGFNYPPEITDRAEVEAKQGTGPLEIRIEADGFGKFHNPQNAVDALLIRIERGESYYRTFVVRAGDVVALNPETGGMSQDNFYLAQPSTGKAFDLGQIGPAIQSISRCLYIGPFRNAVNVGEMSQYFDLKIGQAFIREWRRLQTGNVRRDNEATQELTELVRTAFGFDSLAIMPSQDDSTFVLYVNLESRRLGEVGAGLAQWVICLVNAAVVRPDWILIDEPEMNLHPRLQTEFLRALGSFAASGVVYATHSLGLARQGQDIYSFQAIRQGETDVKPYGATARLAEFLGELGFGTLREIGYDRLLMVEGPNDILPIKEMLRWYGKEHSTVVLPLGGGQRIRQIAPSELAELLQITDRVAAIIDSERTKSGQALDAGRKAFVRACESAGVPCLALKRRAIENYLTESAIRSVKSDKYRALGPFEKLKDADPSWSKAENWRIVAQMHKDDLRNTDLGDFLESL